MDPKRMKKRAQLSQKHYEWNETTKRIAIEQSPYHIVCVSKRARAKNTNEMNAEIKNDLWYIIFLDRICLDPKG